MFLFFFIICRCTSCRFWPQVAFAWMVAWLARLKTDGKRPVDELNLKSLAGLRQSSYQLTIRLDSSQAGEEKDSSCHGSPSWQAGLHWLWVSRPSLWFHREGTSLALDQVKAVPAQVHTGATGR